MGSDEDPNCRLVTSQATPWGHIFLIADDSSAPTYSPIFFILVTNRGPYLVDPVESEYLGTEGSQGIQHVQFLVTGPSHIRVSITFTQAERSYNNDGFGYQQKFTTRTVTHTWICGPTRDDGFGCNAQSPNPSQPQS